MILDEKLEFCDATSVAAAAGTANVGDVVDLRQPNQRIGSGDPLVLVISVSTAFTSGGSATVQFKLVSDDSATPATNGTQTEHVLTDIFAYTELTLGKFIVARLPAGSLAKYERYLGLQVVTAGATTTAGSINAFLTVDADDWAALADAVN